MNDDEKKDIDASEATGAETRAEDTRADSGTESLDFGALDLTVETVEERISPSETNVFDK